MMVNGNVIAVPPYNHRLAAAAQWQRPSHAYKKGPRQPPARLEIERQSHGKKEDTHTHAQPTAPFTHHHSQHQHTHASNDLVSILGHTKAGINTRHLYFLSIVTHAKLFFYSCIRIHTFTPSIRKHTHDGSVVNTLRWDSPSACNPICVMALCPAAWLTLWDWVTANPPDASPSNSLCILASTFHCPLISLSLLLLFLFLSYFYMSLSHSYFFFFAWRTENRSRGK